MRRSIFYLLVFVLPFAVKAQSRYEQHLAPTLYESVFDPKPPVMPGASNPGGYLPLLRGKRVALVINQTSEINGVSILDMLLAYKVNVTQIFVPEHGFRGNEDAGAHIASGIDSATKLPVVSLYGNNKKPKPEQLTGIDVVIYDLQDVGARFYTYISTLEYCMEACAENGKQLIVFDRPNPNGFYVDGPVMQKEHRSFVGMQAIPVVYGMTPGEYAQMLVGEKWVNGAEKLDLKVIKCQNYNHSTKYKLPVAPSPNLRTMEAVYAYPSLCLFEGTPLSLGRGTDKPFRQYGCPEFEGKFTYTFTPTSGYGAKKPPLEGKTCYGELVAPTEMEILEQTKGTMQLKWLIKAFELYPTKSKFFTSFFTTLAGTKELEAQIRSGKTAETIRKTWENDLIAFKKIRKKYLLYDDFE